MPKDLTQPTFDHLLDALDAADREAAGVKYIALREELGRLFTMQGISDAEYHADDALNRVAQRLMDGEEIQNLRAYAFGIARQICREIWRTEERKSRIFEELASRGQPDESEIRRREIVHACLEECLRQCDSESAALVMDYYRGERGAKIARRKQLQTSLNLSEGGLRTRAYRIRLKIEACVRACTERHEK